MLGAIAGDIIGSRFEGHPGPPPDFELCHFAHHAGSPRGRLARFTRSAMADRADAANVIVRPPIAWALAVLAGLTLNWLMPLPFAPAMLPAGWLGATVFALALALVA
jgi:hypothetical protein